MPEVNQDASAELLQEVDNLRNALRNLVEIVIKLYITSWYTHISPRDQTFLNVVRNTTLACLNSVIDDLTETQQRRNDAKDRLQEFIFTTAPTIFERHIKAYRQAKDDVIMMQPELALDRDAGPAGNKTRNSAQSSFSTTSMLGLAPRYQLYASHPGMRSVESSLGDPRASAPTTPTRKEPVEIHRPTKLRGIDESLADALSSSITALPPRHSGEGFPGSISGTHGELDSDSDSDPDPQTQLYEPSPQYLSVLVDHLLRKHLPKQDYASHAERSMVTEVLANAVLGNALRKCSEPWFIWRIGLNLIREDRLPPDAHPEPFLECNGGVRQEAGTTGSSTSASSGNSTTAPVTRYIALLGRILNIIVATCIYAMAAVTRSLLQTLQTDPPSIEAQAINKPRPKYLLEPWIEASIAWTSAESAFGTRELWTAGKMVYISSWKTVDGIAQDIVATSLDVDSATWIVKKLTDTLFPDGALAPAIPDPTTEEAEAMRKELERCVYNRMPAMARFLLLGTSDMAQQRTLANALDVFSNPSANANLLLSLAEAALKALVA